MTELLIEDIPHSGHRSDSYASDCARCGMELIAERVIDLWNGDDGWIPGAAYRALAEALRVKPDRLSHYDMTTKRQVGPPEHRYRGQQIRANEMTTCAIWVNGEQCGKSHKEHR